MHFNEDEIFKSLTGLEKPLVASHQSFAQWMLLLTLESKDHSSKIQFKVLHVVKIDFTQETHELQ